MEEALGTLPPDDPIHVQVEPHLKQAYTLLGRMDRGEVTDAVSILDGTKRLSKILENFDQAIRLRKIRTEPAAPAPVERQGKYQGKYEDDQGIRQRYEDLVSKEADLEQQLGNWRNFFRRGQLQQSLLLVTRDIKNYRVKFPFVTQPRDFTDQAIRKQESVYQKKQVKASYFGNPQEAVKKYLAVERADVTMQLQQRELAKEPPVKHDYPKISREAFGKLQELLQNTPSRTQNYDQWYSQCIKAEAYLSVYSQEGTTEQSQTAKYWKDKLEVLEKIKPALFGRAEWQKQYQHAKEERTLTLHRARAEQLRTQQRAA